MKILCVFGKYQYGKKERGLSTEYFSFMPAFESLGVEIAFFDSWDRSLYSDFLELNMALIETVKKENPDIIFSVQLGYEIWLETWDFIRANFDCKTINWCTDDSWKYKEHSRFLAPHFDLMVTTYKEFLPKYKAIGTNAILSGWATPVQWIKDPKSAKDCKYKVSFVGAAHGDRKEKVEYLKSCGIEIVCFGYGWENGPIEANEIPNIFNDSIISLNFANSKGENQIKARVFEVTGSGGFLLTENAKNLDKVFNDGEIAIFRDLDECVKKISYFLQNLDVRDKMVENSFQRCKENYTYANRLKKIVDVACNLPKNRVKNIDFDRVVASHKKSYILVLIKNLLIRIGTIFFGKEKGKRFARRVVYEFSWRFFGANTYKARGIVGRMFYSE